jgi:type III pantothenate kinase
MIENARLLVDIGNTRIKWALAHSGRLWPGLPFATADPDFGRAWSALPPPVALWVSTVAKPELAASLSDWSARRWGLSPRFVQSEARACGVTSGYDEPARLGVDRWLALIGARGRCRDALCVADCGTAITVDWMDAEGRHRGGLIAPGLAMMRDSLARGAHGLRRSEVAAVSAGFGHDTATAISGGTAWAAAGLIERAVREAARVLDGSLSLLLTGGDGAMLAELVARPADFAPDLILEGLWAMAEEAE